MIKTKKGLIMLSMVCGRHREGIYDGGYGLGNCLVIVRNVSLLYSVKNAMK